MADGQGTLEPELQQQQAPPSQELQDKWGDPISPERRAQLQRRLDAWAAEQDHGERKGPFDGTLDGGHIRLTGADVFWLAERVRRDDLLGGVPDLHLEGADLRFAQLAGADLRFAQLAGADLTGAQLKDAHLTGAQLERAHLTWAQLERARLSWAQLEHACLFGAQLEHADLGGAKLAGAMLRKAQLAGAILHEAQLEHADLIAAQLEHADLRMAQLGGTFLRMAQLAGADLSGAWLDTKTDLSGARLDSTTRLRDLYWGGVGSVDLTQLPWDDVACLGDERALRRFPKVTAIDGVVRAYRQLAAQLRAQGLAEVADRFALRAQVVQRRALLFRALADWRRPWRLPGDLGRYLGSAFLALLAGYGYRPFRTILLYLAFIAAFAAGYFAYGTKCPVGSPLDVATIAARNVGSVQVCTVSPDKPMTWNEAFVVSFTAFHGRGIFATTFQPADPQAGLAAAEAVLGLVIEVSFIATFTQRFFGAK